MKFSLHSSSLTWWLYTCIKGRNPPNDQLLLIEAVVSGGEGPELQSHCGTTGSPSGRVSPVSRGLPHDWGEEWMLHRCVVVKTELTLKLISYRSTPQVYSHLWSWPLWSESWIQTTEMSFLCPVSVSSLETGWRSRWGGSGRSRTPSGVYLHYEYVIFFYIVNNKWCFEKKYRLLWFY